MKTNQRYEAVCKMLGMDSSIHFVKINRGGYIGFSCGKPDEIKLLYSRVISAGFRPSAGLKKTINQIYGYEYC